jgi:hypothetical protein
MFVYYHRLVQNYGVDFVPDRVQFCQQIPELLCQSADLSVFVCLFYF